jgi:hypothetical protein
MDIGSNLSYTLSRSFFSAMWRKEEDMVLPVVGRKTLCLYELSTEGAVYARKKGN